ncbi:hypothetical protein ES705_47978 [subsurface metagenome]
MPRIPNDNVPPALGFPLLLNNPANQNEAPRNRVYINPYTSAGYKKVHEDQRFQFEGTNYLPCN